MKLIDVYNEYKLKYKEYCLIIESGIFYNVYNNDTGIINKLLGYKIKYNKNIYLIGFPNNSLHKVLNILKQKSINYLVLGKDNNGRYYISDKLKNNKNKYQEYIFDYKRMEYLNKRISDINNKLLEKIVDVDIENTLVKIESLL